MDIWTSWDVLGFPRVSWGIKTDRNFTMFIIKFRFIFIECVIKSDISIQKILSTFCFN